MLTCIELIRNAFYRANLTPPSDLLTPPYGLISLGLLNATAQELISAEAIRMVEKDFDFANSYDSAQFKTIPITLPSREEFILCETRFNNSLWTTGSAAKRGIYGEEIFSIISSQLAFYITFTVDSLTKQKTYSAVFADKEMPDVLRSAISLCDDPNYQQSSFFKNKVIPACESVFPTREEAIFLFSDRDLIFLSLLPKKPNEIKVAPLTSKCLVARYLSKYVVLKSEPDSYAPTIYFEKANDISLCDDEALILGCASKIAEYIQLSTVNVWKESYAARLKYLQDLYKNEYNNISVPNSFLPNFAKRDDILGVK